MGAVLYASYELKSFLFDQEILHTSISI